MSPRSPSAPTAAVRRRLTILFTDLVGSTKLGREMETEEFLILLHELREICRAATEARGGRIARMQGDGATIVFGFPDPGEDDGRRAADAALEIHEKVSALRPAGLPPRLAPLRMHSGIHAGTALIAAGDIEKGVFDLVGDVPNVAARLSQRAGAGQILASDDALGPNAFFFTLGASSGGGPDLPVHAVLGRSAAARRFDSTASRGLTPFIGRGEIVRQLRDFVLDRDSASRATVILGGAGMGKTRLVEEVLASLDPDDVFVLHGGCENYLGAEILQPFLQMMRGFIGLRDGQSADEAIALAREALEPWRGALGPRIDSVRGLLVASPDIRPADAATRAVDDLCAFVRALAGPKRVTLVIDDWQWADDATRRLMSALLQSDARLRVLLTSRTGHEGADLGAGAPQIELQPFDGAETARAVRRWLPQADPFLIARIHDYAGGVPLYIEELCHLATADKLSQALASRGRSGWIAALVAARLQRLPEDQADVVRAAAVVGNVAPYRSLIAACGHAPDEATLRALAEADFLYVDAASGGLRFKHGVTRDSVYESIGLATRRLLHRRVAAAHAPGAGLDHDDTLETLAYHSFGAGDWNNAARFAEQAGDKATSAFALDRARAQYKAALDAMDNLADRGRDVDLHWCLVVNKLGMASIFDPLSLRDDVSLFERAAELARAIGDLDAQARAIYWLGYMCYGFGRFREGVAHAQRAADLARQTGDERLIAQIDATLGQILAAAGRYDEALVLIDDAVVTKKRSARPGGGVAIGSAYALSCEAGILADRGDFVRADACFEQARTLLGDSNHPVANSMRNWRVVSLIWRGAWEEAESLAVENGRVAEDMRGLLLLAASRAGAGYARWRRTGEPDALRRLRDAIRWMEGREFKFFVSVQYSWLVEACAETGDIVDARRYGAHVLRRARNGERLGEAATSRALASIAAREGDLGDVARWMNRAARSARLRGSRRETALNAAVGAAIGASPSDAEAACAQLRAMGMDWHADRFAPSR